MRTVLYARVSTLEQTIAHQRTQAESAGFKIDEVVSDDGVSGVSTRLAERPQGRRLFDILRAGDTLVVRWVDRLGRNYADVTDTIREFMRRGVVVRTIINGLVFDGATTDPMQAAVRDALIGFMAALSQAQAEATKEAQKAGVAHAKAKGECQPLSWPRAELRSRPVHHRAGHARAGFRHIRHRQGHRPHPADRLSHPSRSGRGGGDAHDLGGGQALKKAAVTLIPLSNVLAYDPSVAIMAVLVEDVRLLDSVRFQIEVLLPVCQFQPVSCRRDHCKICGAAGSSVFHFDHLAVLRHAIAVA